MVWLRRFGRLDRRNPSGTFHALPPPSMLSIARRYNAPMQERLTRVEEKIAYLEQFVGELDGVVRQMHGSLDGLRREIALLRTQTEQAGQSDQGIDPDDLEAHKPPHY